MGSPGREGGSISNRHNRSEAVGRKQNIRRIQPLPFQSKQRGPKSCTTEEEKLEWCKQMYESLPKQSAYARHKIKVLAKAISILETDRYTKKFKISCKQSAYMLIPWPVLTCMISPCQFSACSHYG
jgi:hypothetical protein